VGTNKPTAEIESAESESTESKSDQGPGSRAGRILVETEVLMLFGLVAFVALALVAEDVLGLDAPLSLGPFASIALAAAPASLWLGYFYRQDRHEPEPKHFVFGVFLVGAFIAAPLSEFLIEQTLSGSLLTPLTLNPLSLERIVSAVLVVAVAQELTKYAVVRYTMYPSREFDEPLDGFVYSTAVGIGFATYLNVQYLRGSGGDVLLASAAATTVVTTLAHACFAGVTGYALGVAKFLCRSHARRTVALAAGLVAAIVLNGAFQLVASAARSRGFTTEPWREVAFAAGFVVVVFFVVSILARRLLAASPHAPDLETTAETTS